MMLKTTNAKVMISPFEGWGNHTQFQFDNHFICDERIFPEPIQDGKVTLNGVTFEVIYDKGADNVETTPAQLKEVV